MRPQPAAEAGLAPTQALLALVAASALRLDAAAAAAGADAMLAFLLRALDLRSAPPPALLGAEHQAEQAAVAALCALTLKLSETKFKPLFLRVLEWAAGAPAGSYASIARLTALFSVAAALAEKLRSLFVPYYRHLVDLAVKHLAIAASATTAGSSGKKKGKRAREEAGAAEAAAALAAQCGDAELDASVALADRSAARLAGEGLEHGRAAVAALVALAVAANSDVHWKPLNHQVRARARLSICACFLLLCPRCGRVVALGAALNSAWCGAARFAPFFSFLGRGRLGIGVEAVGLSTH